MNDIREFYNFINSIWKYIKNTQPPAQDDHAAWERIIDRNSELHHEFAIKLAEWMELLGEESRNGKRT